MDWPYNYEKKWYKIHVFQKMIAKKTNAVKDGDCRMGKKNVKKYM